MTMILMQVWGDRRRAADAGVPEIDAEIVDAEIDAEIELRLMLRLMLRSMLRSMLRLMRRLMLRSMPRSTPVWRSALTLSPERRFVDVYELITFVGQEERGNIVYTRAKRIQRHLDSGAYLAGRGASTELS